MAHSQIERNSIEKYGDKEHAKSDIHSPQSLVPGDFNRLIMGTIRNNHRAQTLQEQNRCQREGQHDDGLLDEIAKIGKAAYIR